MFVLAAVLLLAGPSSAADAPVPIEVVSVTPLKVPWSTTRSSWEETKEIAVEHWKAIPFAQIAAAMFVIKTGLSAPYDLMAAPFRQGLRSSVAFRLRGRIVDAGGKPVANAKLVVRCSTPLEVAKHGYDTYESARYGPIETDGEGRVELQGAGDTGASPRFMIHLDVEDGPRGAGSAGAYAVSLSSVGPSVSLELAGDWKLVP